jgi:hypothetical protein
MVTQPTAETTLTYLVATVEGTDYYFTGDVPESWTTDHRTALGYVDPTDARRELEPAESTFHRIGLVQFSGHELSIRTLPA